MSGPLGPGIHELAAQTLVDGWHHAGRDGEKFFPHASPDSRVQRCDPVRALTIIRLAVAENFSAYLDNALGLMESHQDTGPLPYDGCHDPLVEYWHDGSPWG